MGANDKLEATFHPNDDLEPAVPGPIESSLMAEPETVGDWAGHTPKIEELDPEGPAYAAVMHRANIEMGISSLVTISGENSRDHGFHEDWPQHADFSDSEIAKGGFEKQLGLAVTQKLMLMAEELLESFGEIRDGRPLDETYFVDKKGLIGAKGAEYDHQVYGEFDDEGNVIAYTSLPGGLGGYKPLLKPEGFLVEIADLFIRGADLVYLLKLREAFVQALEIKHEYNATRPFKHGRQF